MTDNVAEPRDLSQLEGPGALEEIVKGLASLKIELDRYSRKRIGQPLLNDLMNDARGTCSISPDSLLHMLLPFLNWEPSDSPAYRAFVPPRNVIGGSTKGFPENVPATEVAGKVERYASYFGSKDNAFYVWYKPLGLFLAHEGKHRVAFMRAHNQPAIAAWVREAAYPDPSRITIIEPTDDRDECFALLDGRFLQVLRSPSLSRAILKAYGVQSAKWQSLADLPDEDMVQFMVYKHRLHRPPRTRNENARTLDIKELIDQEKQDSEVVTRGIHDLIGVKWDWKRYAAIAGSLLLIGALFLFFENQWSVGVGLGLLGVAVGLGIAPDRLKFKGPRRVNVGKRSNVRL